MWLLSPKNIGSDVSIFDLRNVKSLKSVDVIDFIGVDLASKSALENLSCVKQLVMKRINNNKKYNLIFCFFELTRKDRYYCDVFFRESMHCVPTAFVLISPTTYYRPRNLKNGSHFPRHNRTLFSNLHQSRLKLTTIRYFLVGGN